MARGKTVGVPRREATLYSEKSREFLEQARDAQAADRYDAALLAAIHAAISGIDAATVALAGLRSTDPNHLRAADLLEEVTNPSSEGRERAKQLRALLGRKNAVEYESRKASAKDARDGVERAARIVEWSRNVVGKARL